MTHLPILTAFTATNSIPVWDETTPLLATAAEKRFTCPRRRPAEFSRSLPRQQTGWGVMGRLPVLGELLGVLWWESLPCICWCFQKVGRTVLVWS